MNFETFILAKLEKVSLLLCKKTYLRTLRISVVNFGKLNMEQLAELTKMLTLSIQEQSKMTQQFLVQQQQLQQQQEMTKKTKH